MYFAGGMPYLIYLQKERELGISIIKRLFSYHFLLMENNDGEKMREVFMDWISRIIKK